MSHTNRQLRLKTRPEGLVRQDNFDLVELPVPELADGQALVRVLYLSMDPTNRVWMSDIPRYMPPVAIGETMRGLGLGLNFFKFFPVISYTTASAAHGEGWSDYNWESKICLDLQCFF